MSLNYKDKQILINVDFLVELDIYITTQKRQMYFTTNG